MTTRLIILACLIPFIGLSQTNDTLKSGLDDSTNKIFRLGEVTVIARKGDEQPNRLHILSMQVHNKMEVSKALNLLPGIALTASGPRNESMVSLRGFDLRAVPVYMDGIPVYVPFDGYVDLARFTTFDLAAIDISKGFSSVLYGPNSLGGAINLISRKPMQKYEVDGAIGIIHNNGYKGNINLGLNFGQFFIQGGYSYLYRDAYCISAKYDSTKNENGKSRDNSYRTDKKYSLKIGWAPNKNQEYVLGYINQQGKKGTPVYAGKDTSNSLLKKPRYWQWPYWNKETYYFISSTGFAEKHYLKTRFYYDIFKNALNSFDDATYTTQTKPYAFQSLYNDYTYGTSLEYGTTWLPKNNLKFALHFKRDVHRENNANEPVRHFTDNTFTISVEDVYHMANRLVLIPGISYSERKNHRAEDYNSVSKQITDFEKSLPSKALNGQIGLFYYLKNNGKIGASAAAKTRFATIKDRYSYRLGTAIPNPGLKPERAVNYELNYSGRYFKKLSVQAALFYTSVRDAILSVNNVQPGKSQMQNTGKATFKGVEAGIEYEIFKNLSINTNYTYIERKNISNPTVSFTDVPNTKLVGYLQYAPLKKIRVMAGVEYNSARFSTSYGVKAAGFTLVNATASVEIWKYCSIEAGANNIFDINYNLVEGYPEEGRNIFLTVRFFNR